jgi:hypothetical protein
VIEGRSEPGDIDRNGSEKNMAINLGTQRVELSNLDNNWNRNRLRKAFNRMQLVISHSDRVAASDAGVVKQGAFDNPLPFSLLAGTIGFCAIWTWVTLGGISQYLTGICFVRRDGRRIGVLRSALRALLLYLPVFLLAYWIHHWPLHEAQDIFWTTQLKRLFFALPFIYLATTLLRSNQTPLDMITNTAAIPR